jgi:hypothetical protein
MKNTIVNLLRGAALTAVALTLSAVPTFAQYSSPIHDVDNPARQPVHLQQADSPNGVFSFTVVPANKRLVVENINVQCIANPTTNFGVNDGNVPFEVFFAPPTAFPGLMSVNVRMYVNPGAQLMVFANSTCQVDVYGYYVSLP